MSPRRRLTAADVRGHCLAKPGAWLDQPWEGDHVAKVGDKIFAFLGGGDAPPGEAAAPAGVGLKCGRAREEADEWVQRFPDDARSSAYIGRFGWNVLTIGGAIPDDELLEAVDASYEQVVAGLPRSNRPG
ncbi:MAG: MmcQ/YjbR family DNA-binding protein [Actinomycetales bacterium]